MKACLIHPFHATIADLLVDIIFPHIPDLERLTSDVSSESNETEASLSSSLIPSPHSLPSYEENTEYDEDYLESLYSEVYTER